jgi:hypothetical protein
MLSINMHNNDELLRDTLANLRHKWVLTPGFELLAFKRLAEYPLPPALPPYHLLYPLTTCFTPLCNFAISYYYLAFNTAPSLSSISPLFSPRIDLVNFE